MLTSWPSILDIKLIADGDNAGKFGRFGHMLRM